MKGDKRPSAAGVENMLEKAVYRWFFTIKSGVLLILSFPFSGSLFPLIFVALVPLILVENALRRKSSFSVFVHAYTAFFIYKEFQKCQLLSK